MDREAILALFSMIVGVSSEQLEEGDESLDQFLGDLSIKMGKSRHELETFLVSNSFYDALEVIFPED
jgi:hypothetical protein